MALKPPDIPKLKGVLLFILFLAIKLSDSRHRQAEDWALKSEYSDEEKAYYTKHQYPSVKKCEKISDIILIKMRITYDTQDPYKGPDMSTWSAYLNDFVFYNPRMDDDPTYLELEKSFRKSDRYLIALLGTPIILTLYPLGFIMALFLAPIISMVAFRAGFFLWRIIFTTSLRKVIRRLFIAFEKCYRWKTRRTQPFHYNLKQPREFYYLPEILRDFPAEEEPFELQNTQGTISVMIEESSSDIDEDLIYHEFFRPSKYKPKPIDIERIWEPNRDEILQVARKDKIDKLKSKFEEHNEVDRIWQQDTEEHRAQQIAKIRTQRKKLQRDFGGNRWGRMGLKHPINIINYKTKLVRKTSSDEIFEKLNASGGRIWKAKGKKPNASNGEMGSRK